MLLRLLLFFVSLSMMVSTLTRANDVQVECKNGKTAEQCPADKAEQLITEEVNNRFWFDKTFNAEREQVFSRLQAEFDQDPWGVCTLRLGPQPTYTVDKQQREVSEMDIFAGGSEMFDAELISLTGNIDLQRADQRLRANQADFNQASGVLDLYGDIIYSDGGILYQIYKSIFGWIKHSYCFNYPVMSIL